MKKRASLMLQQALAPIGLALLCLTLASCQAVESSRRLEPPKVALEPAQTQGPQYKVVVADFNNQSPYKRGIFGDSTDRLGQQAKAILKSHLQMTNRFVLVERDSQPALAREAAINKRAQKLTGAQYAVTGSVTEFGRKTIGDRQLFGILGRGKKQIAYAKVALNIVSVDTSEIVASVQGAGEFELSEREIIGFGSTASYDATLNGKVLNLAIMEAISPLVKRFEQLPRSAE